MNNVTGNLRKSGNYWHTVIHYYDKDGIRHTDQKTTKIRIEPEACTKRERDKGARQNLKEAERILQEKLSEYRSKYSLEADHIPFYEWVERWLDEIDRQAERGKRQKSSVIIYRQQTEKHIIPYFMRHKIMLSDLRTKDISQFYKFVLDMGLSPNTVTGKIHSYIKQSLSYAVSEDLLQSNPAVGAILPQKTTPITEYYSKENVLDLLNKTKGTSMEIPIYLAAKYGLRRSEIAGLRWESIDFENRKLSIDNVSVYEGSRLIDKPNAKNSTSNRELPLDKTTYNYLRSLRKKQQENRLRFGETYVRYDHDYVCVKENGERIKPNYMSKAFKKTLKELNLPVIKLHALRHTCASLLLSEGVELKDVQDWLGHSDIRTTANIYGHISMDRKRKLGDNLEKLLGSQSG